MEELFQLMNQKDALEEEIKHLNHKIQAIDEQKSFSKDLVDREGFPRADLDYGELAEYRNLKRRFNQLNNDHLALMKIIETKMYAVHAEKRKDPEVMAVVQEEEERTKQTDMNPKKETETEKIQKKAEKPKEKPKEQKTEIQYLTPFAKLSAVEVNSPADVGGLKAGDLLSEFATVNIYTPDTIKQIPHVVVENRPLRIVVLREAAQDSLNTHSINGKKYAKIVVEVKPERWSGRGLLGCKIDPIL